MANTEIEEQLKYFQTAIENIKETYLKENKEVRKKNSWMTQDILNLIENKRTKNEIPILDSIAKRVDSVTELRILW